MAWKHLTNGSANYYINLENVAALEATDKGTIVIFSALDDERRLSIFVDQSPHQILAGEEVS